MYVCMSVCLYVWYCGVVVSMFDFHRSDRGFPNDYHNTILQHHWQVSENHARGSLKPCEGNWRDGNCSEAYRWLS